MMSKAKNFVRFIEQISPEEVTVKINEFVSLKRELDEIERRAKALSARSEILEKELLPIIKESKDQVYLVDKAIVEYKTRKVTSGSYKALFEEALTKVNGQIKSLLQDLKEKTIVSNVKEYLGVKYESIFSDLLKKFRSWVSSTWDKLRGAKKAVSELVNVVKRGE